ncbi:MAG TPA: protein kinase [Bacilli bacterium]|nr:protein kinase [Bacilli bacterium]
MMDINAIIDSRYRVVSLLGEGGMAEVYEAQDIITRKLVAVKIIKDDVSLNQQNIIRFEREARASATISHPNIVRVLNLGTFKGKPYMVNELVKGVTLEEALQNRGRYTYAEALDIMDQLCVAVDVAHENMVIHRDIKPSNIYITPDGILKLGDFGIAIYSNAIKITKSDDIVGSAHYLAPEISQGKVATAQSDIYSMGVTFFELITGRLPFEGESNIAVAVKHIKERFPSPRKYISSCPRAIEKIIMHACRKRPSDRYINVREMQKDIKKIKSNPKLMEPHRSFWVKYFGFATDD